jgi:flagellin-like hook-associated protein FlgL
MLPELVGFKPTTPCSTQLTTSFQQIQKVIKQIKSQITNCLITKYDPKVLFLQSGIEVRQLQKIIKNFNKTFI